MRRSRPRAAFILATTVIAGCQSKAGPTSPTGLSAAISQMSACGQLSPTTHTRTDPLIVPSGGDATGIYNPHDLLPGVWTIEVRWSPASVPMTGQVNIVDTQKIDWRGPQVATLSGNGVATACWNNAGADPHNFKLTFPEGVRVDGTMTVRYPVRAN